MPSTDVIIGIIIIVALGIVVRFVAGYVTAKAGGNGKQRRENAKALKEQADWLRSHHQIIWVNSPAHLRSSLEGWPDAASANYAMCRGVPIDRFNFSDGPDEAAMLSNAWGIRNAAELRDQLLSLLQHGHRERFDAERQNWANLKGADERRVRGAMYKAAQEDADAAEDFRRYRWVRQNANDCVATNFLAWDLVRVIMLCRAGVAAGYLSEDEALDTAWIASRGLQETYSSWQDMVHHFFEARWYWSSEDGVDGELGRQHNDHAQQVLATAPDSPWAMVPWTAQIPTPNYLLLDHMPHAYPNPAPQVRATWTEQLEYAIAQRASNH